MEKDRKKIALNTEAEYNKLAKAYRKIEDTLYVKNKEIELLHKKIEKLEKRLSKKIKHDLSDNK